VPVGSNLTRTFTIQNTGTQGLAIVSYAISGANGSLFSATNFPAFIAAGASATLNLTFTPTTTGLKTATLTITNDDCDEAAYDFVVQGTGLPCPAQLTLVSPADDYASGSQIKSAAATNGNITATNKITGTAQVTYGANVIELRPGFQATGGTVFSAQQGGCN
jgi:Abnormal spindle-like microcephaly-assoc'd, ASPM-SPD-2-Hydin